MRKILTSFFILALISCSPSIIHHVKVSSIKASDVYSKNTFIIIPADSKMNPKDLLFAEFSSLLRRMLELKDLIYLDDINKARYVVTLSYGVSQPTEKSYSYSVPVYGQTGYQSASTTGSVQTYGNQATYNQNTTYTPQYGIQGYRSISGSYTVYTRMVMLKFFSNFGKKSEEEHQRITLSSIGGSSDLRLILPYMLFAGSYYFGKDSGHEIEIALDAEDERIQKLRES